MIKIDLGNLNPLEQRIYDKLLESSKVISDITITKAAELCDCSISKISKFTRKLGFKNYKQYADFLYGNELPNEESSSEFERLKKFMDDFDFTLIDDFIELLSQYDKICLFGYGPSFIVAQYFEYKLRFSTSKYTIALPDELSVINMLDDNTLLVIFTTTGAWRSFENIYGISRKRGGKVLIIAEEFNSLLMSNCDRLFWLSKYNQPNSLDAHEKSRTVFFIFIEEIIHRLLLDRKGE